MTLTHTWYSPCYNRLAMSLFIWANDAQVTVLHWQSHWGFRS